jgi:serine phosphatase RsbU (regulator of sigma subunit)
VLRRLYGKTPDYVADHILADLDEFTAGAPRHDDQTMVILKVR